jgi:4-amino-4-deoxy-L-arabinose transferase-like glycosyltransferase
LVPGLVLFALIAAPYFLFVYARDGAGPLRFFFLGENIQRFTGHVYGASGRPVWYELTAFFSDFAPWSIFIFVAVWFNWRDRANASSAARLLHLWLGAAIVLFSLSSFKLDYYLLPAMPASALIVAPVIANAEKLPNIVRRCVQALLVLCAAMIVVVALLSLKAAAVLSVSTSLRFLPIIVAVAGFLVVTALLGKRKTWQSTFVLTATMWLTFVTMQWALLPAFVGYLPATRLAAAVPAGSAVYTSSGASDWANGIAFNLPAPHNVERLIGDKGNEELVSALKSDAKSVAIIRQSEYATLLSEDPSLKIIGQAETFGHGGLSLNLIRNPRRERLLLVGHDG